MLFLEDKRQLRATKPKNKRLDHDFLDVLCVCGSGKKVRVLVLVTNTIKLLNAKIRTSASKNLSHVTLGMDLKLLDTLLVLLAVALPVVTICQVYILQRTCQNL